MKGKSKVPFLKLVEKFDPNMLCPACEVICTADSRHCYICNQCVERFDHHCPWVNNCIGLYNHNYFYFYLILQTVYLLVTLSMGISNITLLMSSYTLEKARQTVIWSAIVHSSVETAQVTYDLTVVLSLMCSLLFLPFLIMLVYIQTTNFMQNQTTNTRFSKHKRTSVTEQELARLDEDDTSGDDESNESRQRKNSELARTQVQRLNAVEEHQVNTAMGNCQRMLCSSGHFKKQERHLNKFAKEKKRRRKSGVANDMR